MNKTDRLLAIVLELQAKERQRAEDLAATFEVSKRTIYRDIEALCDERPDGLLVTLQARQESDILPWLLSWGRHAVVLAPAILRQHLLAEIDAISKRYIPPNEMAGNMLE